MRLNEIRVDNLFGQFNHRIPTNHQDRITIIHGPNGCGKTTVLKMVQLLFDSQLHELAALTFDAIHLVFEGGAQLDVMRTITTRSSKVADSQSLDAVEELQNISLTFTFIRRGLPNEVHEVEQRHLDISGISLSAVRRFIPYMRRQGPNRWLDGRDGEIISDQELIARYGDRLSSSNISRRPLPEWLKSTLDSIQVHFIQTQRLLQLINRREHEAEFRRDSHRATVIHYSDDIVRQIRDVLAESVGQAQSLDRSFPSRVLGQSLPLGATSEELRTRYEKQQDKHKRLMDAGLIAPQLEMALPDRDLDHTERRLLWTYLHDVDEKLAVFDVILEKLEVIKEIINSRFLYKKFTIHRERGFIFLDHKDRIIPLDALSSGEQHELVLTYELLFRVKAGSLILIDEPELSLHVTWQHKFLGDLARISKLAKLDFIIATHSPQIIHKRWDLAVALEEGVQATEGEE